MKALPTLVLIFATSLTLHLKANHPEALSRLDSSLAQRVEIRSYYSQALQKMVPFSVILPDPKESEKPWPSLFLLHGRGRSHLSLIDDPQSLPILLQQPFAIVLPMGFDGWYINSPVDPAAKYNDALTELEALVDREYEFQKKRESRAIIGWSMGGFGAIHHAATHADRYGFAGSMIGLLDFPSDQTFPEGQSYTVPLKVFGSNPEIWDRYNPALLISKLRETHLHLVIGEGAFDRTMNENFLRAAVREGVSIDTHRLPHAHTFDAVQTALPLLFSAIERHFREQGALGQ